MEQGSVEAVSSTRPDWDRERPRSLWDSEPEAAGFDTGISALPRRAGLVSALSRRIFVARHLFWSAVTGADIPINCKIGGGLLIPHPNGIVIHTDVEIGVNCLIHQQVTIGTKRGGGIPRIEGHVDIGAGAKILGAIVVGEHAQIGANAVVTHDVSRRDTVVGIPARSVASVHGKRDKNGP